MTAYIQQVKMLSESFYLEKGRYPSMFIRTFGCQMNDRESEKLHALLLAMAYEEAPSENNADLVLYNTCCVRESAENKVFGNLGYLKEQKHSQPGKVIVFCGCMPQREEIMTKIKHHHRHIDVIFGTFNKHHFPKLLFEHLTSKKQVVEILQSFDEASPVEPGLQTTRFSPHKAGVTVMHGCDNYCTYCIVPYVRGRETSRPLDDVMAEIEALAADGVREVMLLGQNVNSYAYGFAELVRKVNEIEALKRIRFMTSHPKDLSRDLIEAMRDCEKVCKQIHLPMQSGSSRILEAMNRGYTKEQYLQLISRLRQAIPEIAVTTDIIVGFPGESEDDFADTIDAARTAGFAGAFTFIYSHREGTPAALLKNELPKNVVSERFKRLTDLLNPMQLAHNKRHLGHSIEIMAEGKTDKTGKFTGRSDDYVLVHFDSSHEDIKPGDMLFVEINDCKTFYITGRHKAS